MTAAADSGGSTRPEVGSTRGTALAPAVDAVRRWLLEQIAQQRLAPGARIGAERDLAVEHGVSRSTLRTALEALEAEGAVRRVRGRSGGIFVAERKVERDLTSLAGLPAYLRRQGFEAGARVLATATLEADDETARALGLPAGSPVYEVVRVRLADGDAISLERAVFPATRFPGLLDRPLGGSLYELLETAYDLEPREAEERIEVVSATAREASLLAIPPSAPLVSVVRRAVDRGGVPFECSHDLFRADRVRIIVRSPAQPSPSERLGSVVEVTPASPREPD